MEKVQRERGKEVNKKPPPVLPQELLFVWDAFWDLSSERRNQECNVGPILWTAINDYAYRYCLSNLNIFNSFTFFIKRLDNEYRKIQQDKIKKQRDLNKPRKKR